MTDNSIKLAICQTMSKENKENNLANAADMIKKAASEGSGLIVLPEMFNCSLDIKVFKRFAEPFGAGTTDLLSGLAKRTSSIIVGGSIPEESQNSIYNTCFVFGRDGSLLARHRKIHLFDVDIKGKISFKESSVISPGNKITVFDAGFCKIGIMICYDMRFPELSRAMTYMGAKLLIAPAAFNTTTGPAHWHITTRARAIDNQVFFVAASPARDAGAKYVAYGHSLCVNPWGKIITEASEKEEIVYCDIDLDYIDNIRKSLPLLKHLRKDIY